MITVAEARTLIFRGAAPGPIESTSLLRALGKVLAEPVLAPCCLPLCDHSGVEGYAVRSRDLVAAEPDRPVRLVMRRDAGRANGTSKAVPELESGSAWHVLAGDPLPLGADAVVRADEAFEDGADVCLGRPVAAGENVRGSGADVREGDRLLDAGTVLTPACIALLAGVGQLDVKVHAAPRVAILAAADGRTPSGHLPRPGQLYDSSAFALAAMVSEAGGIPILLGGLGDDREQALLQLREAATHDVILASAGGAWAGADFLAEMLSRHGEIHVDRVAHLPGKPFTYATLWGKPVFALPAPADATLVTFEVYVRPLLRLMTGQRELERPRLWVTMAEAVAKPPGKEAYLRVTLDRTSDGAIAHLAGSPESAQLSGLARANGLVIVPAEASGLAAGEKVEALALAALN